MKPLALSLASLAIAAAGWSSAQAATLFLGAYPNSLMVFDESKGEVVQHIPLATGLPTNMRLSDDEKRLYVTTNDHSGIEVVDPAARSVITSFSVNTPTTRYRFTGGTPDPSGKYYYTIVTQIDKKLDHYEVSKQKYAVIDIAKKAVVKTYDMPAEEENGNSYRSLLMVSPDGKYLYRFGEKVVIMDTADFKVVDRIDLEAPDEDGLGSVNLSGVLENVSRPGELVALFNAADPYVHNKVFGIARFNLSTREFTFTPIGPAPETMAGLQVAPDGKTAYTVTSTGGRLGNKRCEFWRFDMATKAVEQKAEFSCRTRYYFGISGDGQKLYIYGAGYQIEVYDAKTLQYEKTWDLHNDTTMAGLITIR